jgi:4-hydroxy-3-methylbut-2-enyl diphosphate reductase
VNVIVAGSAGFCWGVRRAVEKVRAVASTASSTVYTDGPLIHNRQMIDQLRREGISATDSPADALGGTLVIRAHGIPPDRRRELAAVARELIDATCPDVARIQGLIRSHARKGFDLVIYGDEGHAEVTGLLGYAEGRGHVVGTDADVDRLPELKKVCLVSQSTQLPRSYTAVAERTRARFPGAVVLDTICESTKRRQQDLEELATRVEALVVVGGGHSANTLRLVDLARSLRPTFHIETAADLCDADFKGYSTVGVTAGASTPEFVIAEVRARLEGIGRTPPLV